METNLLQLFWIFLKVNLLSTSGSASVGLLYHEAVGVLVTEEQFVQAVGLSSVLPGSDALQLAMYIGYAVGGGNRRAGCINSLYSPADRNYFGGHFYFASFTP